MLRNIGGESAYKHIILITTKWDEVAPDENTRGKLLDMLVDDRIWGSMASRGSKVAQFKNSRESALSIVELLKQAFRSLNSLYWNTREDARSKQTPAAPSRRFRGLNLL